MSSAMRPPQRRTDGSFHMKRSSGILMHISSLPSPYGIGTLGQAARDFADFLKSAGQTYWQMLPLCPTSLGNSPYQSPSCSAGNPLLIDLNDLKNNGLLTAEEISRYTAGMADNSKVDYEQVCESREILLRIAYERRGAGNEAEWDDFLREHPWLADYALFMALRQHFHGLPWHEWEEGARLRQPEAVEKYRFLLARDIDYHIFVQSLFFRQWNSFREYAGSLGIRLIGDIPIYAAMDSADVWTNPAVFQMDENLRPRAVAGVPPDYFSSTGQLWGNPLYDWDAMKNTGYGWWINRIAAAAKLFDVLRIDHFRGLESYWAVPCGLQTAEHGHWEKGPGMDFIRALQAAFPGLECIAEDLGYLSDEVRRLRDDAGFPGMKVLQFGFDSRDFTDYLPHTFPVNCVVYTGTHDNTTLADWLGSASDETKAYVRAYFALTDEEGQSWGVIRGALSSVAALAVIPMQDYLLLGREARMNTPSTIGGNWAWRLKPGALSPGLAGEIHSLTKLYGRT